VELTATTIRVKVIVFVIAATIGVTSARKLSHAVFTNHFFAPFDGPQSRDVASAFCKHACWICYYFFLPFHSSNAHDGEWAIKVECILFIKPFSAISNMTAG